MSLFSDLPPIARMESPVAVIAMGFMVGTSIVYPSFKHKDTFYHYLTLGIFTASFFAHSYLHWEVIKRYALLAFVIAVTPVGVLFYQTDLPTAFFYDRAPLLAMFTSLMTMLLDHYLEREDLATRQHPLRRLSSIGRLAQATYVHHRHRTLSRISDFRTRPGPQENDVVTRPPSLLAYMYDTEQGAIVRPQSNRSSDISLDSNALESLPHSWDSDTRLFFPEYHYHTTPEAIHWPADGVDD
ncbi:hypothetical protein F4810DRAFT_275584 [Camillea tinctor]|nr:hypothetical protein F4810DRAFT_275584 [Camillea tinctor]